MNSRITLIILLLITACTQVEKSGGTLFRYENSSTRNVTIKVYNATLPNLGGQYDKEYYLSPNDQFQIDYISLGGSCGMLPFGGTADSLIIIFEDNKALKFDEETNSYDNPLFLESYETLSSGEDYCNYFYKITEEDYNNAIPTE